MFDSIPREIAAIIGTWAAEGGDEISKCRGLNYSFQYNTADRRNGRISIVNNFAAFYETDIIDSISLRLIIEVKCGKLFVHVGGDMKELQKHLADDSFVFDDGFICLKISRKWIGKIVREYFLSPQAACIEDIIAAKSKNETMIAEYGIERNIKYYEIDRNNVNIRAECILNMQQEYFSLSIYFAAICEFYFCDNTFSDINAASLSDKYDYDMDCGGSNTFGGSFVIQKNDILNYIWNSDYIIEARRSYEYDVHGSGTSFCY